MPMKKKAPRPKAVLPATFDAALSAFCKKFYALAYVYGRDRVFRDFVELAATALARADQARYDAREARYLQVIAPYKHDEKRFLLPHMLSDVIRMMEFGHTDVFAAIWLKLDLRGNDGQCWTPYHLARMMSELTLGADPKAAMGGKPYLTLCEPACGTGVMIVAAAETMLRQGLNPQNQLYATGIDTDPMCVHMTFIQCSLYGIPAAIHLGNALSGEPPRETWLTPMHFIGHWDLRLAVHDALALMAGVVDGAPPDHTDPEKPLPDPTWANEAWENAGIEERLRLTEEAGITDPEAVMATMPPKAIMAHLKQPFAV